MEGARGTKSAVGPWGVAATRGDEGRKGHDDPGIPHVPAGAHGGLPGLGGHVRRRGRILQPAHATPQAGRPGSRPGGGDGRRQEGGEGEVGDVCRGPVVGREHCENARTVVGGRAGSSLSAPAGAVPQPGRIMAGDPSVVTSYSGWASADPCCTDHQLEVINTSGEMFVVHLN